jgi:SAM-dependent methyltransferase
MVPHRDHTLGATSKSRKHPPQGLLAWTRERSRVNDFSIKRFVYQAAQQIPPGALLLDAGAGECQYKPWLTHTHYIGVDLAIGDTQWDYGNLDAASDLCHLPFGRDVFDVALCTQVLEHVTEPLQVLTEIHRVLKPGGRLLLTAPQSSHQHQKPHDYYRYTSFGLRYLIEQAGMRVVSIDPMGGYFWYLSFQLRNIDYWLFPKGMIGRRWAFPLRVPLILVSQLILPLILFYLDPLDRAKDETFGYTCVAMKPPAT